MRYATDRLNHNNIDGYGGGSESVVLHLLNVAPLVEPPCPSPCLGSPGRMVKSWLRSQEEFGPLCAEHRASLHRRKPAALASSSLMPPDLARSG
jgi:hypothetical protein